MIEQPPNSFVLALRHLLMPAASTPVVLNVPIPLARQRGVCSKCDGTGRAAR
jgi:hypothetical protein